MNQPRLKTGGNGGPLLSVIYKSPNALHDEIKSVSDCTIITDGYFFISKMDHTATSWYGPGPEETIGKFLFDYFTLEKNESTIPEIIRELISLGTWCGKMIYKTDDGNQTFFESCATVIKDKSGHLTAIEFINHKSTGVKAMLKTTAILQENDPGKIKPLTETNNPVHMDDSIGAEVDSITSIEGSENEKTINTPKNYIDTDPDGMCNSNLLEKIPLILIDAIQDITERKALVTQLLDNHAIQQKMISLAIIKAQEKERSLLSAELHDNVNQLLMSSKLHINAAKNSDIRQNELLDKASNYLLMAVEEIRALSKRLNSNIVKSMGLKESTNDICGNMKKFNNILVTTLIDNCTVDKLTDEHQLMLFRIIQEQSNNIIKHANATSAIISINEKNNICYLMICDNGTGFDTTKKHQNGSGFLNILNRVSAFNGSFAFNSAPGKGCSVEIMFPIINA